VVIQGQFQRASSFVRARMAVKLRSKVGLKREGLGHAKVSLPP